MCVCGSAVAVGLSGCARCICVNMCVSVFLRSYFSVLCVFFVWIVCMYASVYVCAMCVRACVLSATHSAFPCATPFPAGP